MTFQEQYAYPPRRFSSHNFEGEFTKIEDVKIPADLKIPKAEDIKDLIERMSIDVEYFSSYTKNDIQLLRSLYLFAKMMEKNLHGLIK